jgi:hypothetical protein
MKETSKENSAAEYEDIKKLLEYLIKVNKNKNDSIINVNENKNDGMKEHNKALIDNTREDIKAFRKSIEANQIKLQKDLITETKTEIERSLKGTELASQRLHREFLDRFNAKTSKCTHLISLVPEKMEVEMITDNQIIQKNVELIHKGASEAVSKRQELHPEVVNVDTVRSLDD